MSPRRLAGAVLRSTACQTLGVGSACALIAALHLHNDGLWFQGDAPRHAANGFLWWDLITTNPLHPLTFALRYYARYPVVNPVAYPPLFHVIEGVILGGFGGSIQAVRVSVVMFGGLSGLYTSAWARRWIAPEAGWVGPLVLLVPGMVINANVILPNVPGTALGIVCLYHFRRWLEASQARQLVLAAVAGTAVVFIYYPAVIVFGACVLWSLATPLRRAAEAPARAWAWTVAAIFVVVLMLAAVALLIPLYVSKHVMTAAALLRRPDTWTYYPLALPRLTGWLPLVAAVAGLIAAACTARWRTEAAYLSIWAGVVVIGLSVLPARDLRYALPIVPPLLLAASLAFVLIFERAPAHSDMWPAAAVAAILALAAYSAAEVKVPRVEGFREVAEYLRRQAPHEAVLYDGYYDGNVGFYLRSLDPNFERRIALGNGLLYRYGPRSTFNWVESSDLSSEQDVIDTIRSRCGCRFIAIEMGSRSEWAAAQRLLRQAVHNPAFEPVAALPIDAPGASRVDVYRLSGPIAAVRSMTLSFPAFTDHAFTDVEPIVR